MSTGGSSSITSLAASLAAPQTSTNGSSTFAADLQTSINRALGLDEAAARAASPLFLQPPARGSLDAVVGEAESAEYFRQSRTIVERWGQAGIPTRFGTVAGANHFTAIAPLAEPNSPMVSRLRELVTR